MTKSERINLSIDQQATVGEVKKKKRRRTWEPTDGKKQAKYSSQSPHNLPLDDCITKAQNCTREIEPKITQVINRDNEKNH